MSIDFRPLEIDTLRATLALRFVDPVWQVPVTDGLAVTAWPAGDPSAGRTAGRSPVSPLFGFAHLPGMGAYERGRASSPPPSLPPGLGTDRLFVVRMVDTAGRFLPVVRSLRLPQPAVVVTTLVSAPARPAPAGLAVLRGEVATSSGTAAAWAAVHITLGAMSADTVADAQGRFVSYLPYPDALPPLAGSFPAGGSLDAITWPVSISVRCEPSALAQPVGASPADPPDSASIAWQASAGIDNGGSIVASLPLVLTFGAPLVVASPGSTRLIVQPA
ncbi:MAG: hypothetical protein NVSMB32_00130 [Actinomycetota bacterium]